MTTSSVLKQTSRPTVQELERALKIAAKVVAMYGDVYLPGFIRLKNELERAKQNDAAKIEAIALAKEHAGV